MNKLRILLFISCLLLFMGGCSNDEVLRIGTPNELGVDFDVDMKNRESIETVRRLVKGAEEVEKEVDLNEIADVFISLDHPKEGIAEIRRFIWYLEDGGIILANEHEDYYYLNNEEAAELKRVLTSK